MKKIILLLITILLITGLACNLTASKTEDESIEPGETSENTGEMEPTEEALAEERVTIEEPTPEKADEAGQAAVDENVSQPIDASLDPSPPTKPVKLIFIHHSSGENWLNDEHGGLGLALMANNYFVSDTNYGWGPDGIGDKTDLGNWWEWFAGPEHERYLEAVFNESGQNSPYSRLEDDPGGENTIIMFKSCFPNSALRGSPGALPATGENPLRGQDASSEAHTVANAKGIYIDLLETFNAHPDKLFIVITAPPLGDFETDSSQAANARALNRWLVEDWLAGYPLNNVAVFDFYNVLTSNGGDAFTNDAGSGGGNHQRYQDGEVQYVTDQGSDESAYAAEGDSHPTAAGNQKATEEFLPLLNIFFHRWLASQP